MHLCAYLLQTSTLCPCWIGLKARASTPSCAAYTRIQRGSNPFSCSACVKPALLIIWSRALMIAVGHVFRMVQYLYHGPYPGVLPHFLCFVELSQAPLYIQPGHHTNTQQLRKAEAVPLLNHLLTVGACVV